MPIGNGLDWKVGVFDSIIGYESVESPNNPNYTRSYGHSVEPTTHTGVLATYRFSDMVSASAGVANTMNASINSRAQDGSVDDVLFGAGPGANAKAESYKTYMGSIAITAPDSMGFLAGSTLYGGVVNGFDNSILGTGTGVPHLNAYVGLTMATPVTGLRLGTSLDVMDVATDFEGTRVNGEVWTVAGYLSYQATEKLSLHGRAEYADGNVDDPVALRTKAKIFALTATAQYDLWKNVLSRLELRWDHSCTGDQMFGGDTAGAPTRFNAWMLAANVVYKF